MGERGQDRPEDPEPQVQPRQSPIPPIQQKPPSESDDEDEEEGQFFVENPQPMVGGLEHHKTAAKYEELKQERIEKKSQRKYLHPLQKFKRGIANRENAKKQMNE